VSVDLDVNLLPQRMRLLATSGISAPVAEGGAGVVRAVAVRSMKGPDRPIGKAALAATTEVATRRQLTSSNAGYRSDYVGRCDPQARRGVDLLRDQHAEVRFAGACLRQPLWWERYALPLGAFTSFEAREIVAALTMLHARGESATIASVSGCITLADSLLLSIANPESHAAWDADVPCMHAYLLDLYRRRLLALVGEAAETYARDGDLDPREGAARLRKALELVQ